MTLAEFLARYPVRLLDGGEGCWLWIGGTAGSYKGTLKYGRLRPGGVAVYAHRHAYELVNGPLDPNQRLVRDVSICDSNELCCNPKHWISVDKRKKAGLLAKQGRVPRGTVHGLAVSRGRRASGQTKLTIEKARAIRASSESAADLAQQYGVDKSLIWSIRRGDVWAEATPFSGLGR